MSPDPCLGPAEVAGEDRAHLREPLPTPLEAVERGDPALRQRETTTTGTSARSAAPDPGRAPGGTLPAPVPSRTRPGPRSGEERARKSRSSDPAARTWRSTAVTSRRGRRIGPRKGGSWKRTRRVEHAHRPESAVEGVEALGVPLADAGGGVDLLADDDQRAAAGRAGVGRRAHRRREVGRAIPAGVGERAHRAAQDDGLRARDREVEEVRRLLERVGAVGDDDAVDLRVGEEPDDAPAQPPHPRRRHVRPGQARHVLEAEGLPA